MSVNLLQSGKNDSKLQSFATEIEIRLNFEPENNFERS